MHVIFSLYLLSLATSIAGMEFFSALILVVTLGLGLYQNKSWERPPFLFPMLAFAGVMFLGILLGDATSDQKWYDLGRLRFFLIFLSLYFFLRHRFPGLSFYLKALGIIALVMGIYAAVQHFIPLDLVRPEGKKIIRYAIWREALGPLSLGTFNHHLTFANVYFLFASVLVAVGLYVRRFRPLLFIGLLVFLDVVWTQSRAAWISLPICLLFLVSFRGWKTIGGVLIGLALLGGLLFAFDAGFREKLTRTRLSGGSEYSLGERSRLWVLQWELFKTSPVIGVGWNNNERRCHEIYAKIFPEQKDVFCGHAHSNLLQILSTAGVLGLLAFLWLWGAIFHSLFRSWRRFPRGSLEGAVALGITTAFIGFHLQGLTEWNFGDAEVLHNVVFLWALTAWLDGRETSSQT